ncbi:hypothetical protein [Pseudophaeobacter sp. EL27]|uniref:DUF7424 family protein n=1 Tax=Pseudophaeobacter sp. EL27 TaxID=2107580 RepID=UPI0013C3EB4B|nr:hypothetical protein [Pseudophaeobacter sp. EL27]
MKLFSPTAAALASIATLSACNIDVGSSVYIRDVLTLTYGGTAVYAPTRVKFDAGGDCNSNGPIIVDHMASVVTSLKFQGCTGEGHERKMVMEFDAPIVLDGEQISQKSPLVWLVSEDPEVTVLYAHLHRDTIEEAFRAVPTELRGNVGFEFKISDFYTMVINDTREPISIETITTWVDHEPRAGWYDTQVGSLRNVHLEPSSVGVQALLNGEFLQVFNILTSDS